MRLAAVLGVTGRLGPAVVRALGDWEVRGLSRRKPEEGETAPSSLVVASRRDERALAEVVDGADVVIDLVGFDEADADVLLGAIARSERKPERLVFASSMAELHPAPHDRYGRGKRMARLRYEQRFRGSVHTLVLPRLVAPLDHGRREQPYLDAGAGGRVLVAGGGEQRQTIAAVDGVGAVIRRLVDEPSRRWPSSILVGPAKALRVRDAVAALLQGAEMDVAIARHPDPAWRGPHGGGDEILETSVFAEILSDFEWPDALDVYRTLGRWLVRHPRPEAPRPLVSLGMRAPAARATVDVHGLRAPPVLRQPVAELSRLAGWLTPAFYLDTGRPCNSACLYCAVPPHADTAGFTPIERLERQIRAGAEVGCTRAILIGGEPTVYPDLWEALALLRASGLSSGNAIMTNGLKLADEAFVERLAQDGIRTFHLSIDTASSETYDRLSRSRGQFSKQTAALENVLRRPDLNAYVYACVTRANEAGLGELMTMVRDTADRFGRRPPVLLLAFAKPIGDALRHADQLLLDPAARVLSARWAVAFGDRIGLTVGLRNLQACLAPELRAHDMDYYLEDFSVDVATGARTAYAHGEYLSYAKDCESCGHRGVCGGIYREDLRRYGEGAFRPIGQDGLTNGDA